MKRHDVFLFVTGAGSCRVIPTLIRGLLDDGACVYCVLTPNVAQVTDPASLVDIPGVNWIDDYGRPPLDQYPFGIQVVAPCTFNTLNKIAFGIADNLVTAMVGDALGAGCPILIAPGMNQGQWANPRVGLSISQLEQWGCQFVPPEVHQGRLTLAPVETIRTEIRTQLAPTTHHH